MTSSLVRLLTLLPSLGDLLEAAPLLACRFSLNLIDCLGPSFGGARILVRHILLTWSLERGHLIYFSKSLDWVGLSPDFCYNFDVGWMSYSYVLVSLLSLPFISYKPSSCCCTSSRRLSSKEIWKFWTMFLQCVPGRWRRWEFPRGHRWWWQAEKIFITVWQSGRLEPVPSRINYKG